MSSAPPTDPGTPTQDEQTSSMTSSSNVGSSLNTLPLFEKLDKLEMAHQEIKKKGKEFD